MMDLASIHPQSDWPPHLPQAFYDGLDALNRGEYFACHEMLETLWLADKESVRALYQGVLQMAVGCYHLTVRANWIGAVRKLEAGARRLERSGVVPDEAEELGRYGVEWRELIASADHLQAHLHALGASHVAEFDPCLLPRVHFVHP